MNIPTTEELLASIDAFRERHGNMAKTRFGRNATGEAELIDSIRKGRSPSLNMVFRISEFMKEEDQKLAAMSSGKTEIVPTREVDVIS